MYETMKEGQVGNMVERKSERKEGMMAERMESSKVEESHLNRASDAPYIIFLATSGSICSSSI